MKNGKQIEERGLKKESKEDQGRTERGGGGDKQENELGELKMQRHYYLLLDLRVASLSQSSSRRERRKGERERKETARSERRCARD
mmetsp:Transcript_32782/g.103716  ORF Transcript_32782/g.103716 Transcript_32782/m.103716 type:complete len:86 (+) Transcript_32782:1872-2129(+)